jgi:D-mannonate dehydratase
MPKNMNYLDVLNAESYQSGLADVIVSNVFTVKYNFASNVVKYWTNTDKENAHDSGSNELMFE